jgi:ABC-2 type transport system permease protein
MSTTSQVQPAPAATVAATASAISAKVLRTTFRSREIIFMLTMQGVLFLLIFRYAFGGAIPSGRLHYVDYMAPGIVTVGVIFSAMRAAVSTAQERATGFVERLRSLPAPLGGAMAGRALAESTLAMYAVGVNSFVAFAVGFRIHGGVVGTLLALGILAVMALAFGAIFSAIGYTMTPEAASGVGFLVLPLTFFSSAFVPVATMPDWLQPFARHQPVTVVIDAVRTLTQGDAAEAQLGHSSGYYAVRALAWMGAFAAIGLAAGVRALRHADTP